MKLRYLLPICFACAMNCESGQRLVGFPLVDQPREIEADLYGSGTQAVLLAHGGQFSKERWKKQAEVLVTSGFLVLALRFRGDGLNLDGSPGSFGSTADNATDVLAGVSYLHRKGLKTVSAVGASMGGDAVGEADAASPPGNIARIVILASPGGDAPERLSGRKLFIVAQEDANSGGLRMKEISSHYERAAEPKQLIVVPGSAHAQFLFQTEEGPRVLNEILKFFQRDDALLCLRISTNLL